MKVAILGCGLMGGRRARALGDAQLVLCIDAAIEKAIALAAQFPGCEVGTDWQAAVKRQDIQLIIISTFHAHLTALALAAICAGKHVLVEKPAGKTAKELQTLIQAAQKHQVLVRVGFNHRYHPALQKARELVSAGLLGELMFIRGRYGHGGRLGYEQEWRANPQLSGGGELIDQGVHLIDLARWFLGDFCDVQSHVHTYYWNMPVDDNAFLMLKTKQQQTAFLHASCTEWKNLFSFEIYGKQGKIDIQGLGGSYGKEQLTFYKMLPVMGVPESSYFEYPLPDSSFHAEFAEFLEDIKLMRQPSANLYDAYAALSIVETVYRASCYDHCT